MRDIEFRGKRQEIGQFATLTDHEWVYGGYVKDSSGVHIHSIMYTHRMVKVDPETVGQYTGWMDCKEQKIFEGDIIKISLPITGCNPIVGVSEVYFDKGCFCVNWGGSYRPHHRTRIDSFIPETTFEVIGNIHDNPELLEQ